MSVACLRLQNPGVLKNRARTRCAFIVVLKERTPSPRPLLPPVAAFLKLGHSGVACFTPDWSAAARSELQ